METITETVTARQFRAQLSSLVNHTVYAHGRVGLDRYGQLVAVLIGIDDFQRLRRLESAPGALDPEDDAFQMGVRMLAEAAAEKAVLDDGARAGDLWRGKVPRPVHARRPVAPRRGTISHRTEDAEHRDEAHGGEAHRGEEHGGEEHGGEGEWVDEGDWVDGGAGRDGVHAGGEGDADDAGDVGDAGDDGDADDGDADDGVRAGGEGAAWVSR